MTTFERRQRILALLREKPGIKVTELAHQLGVSQGTIRNDLTALEQSNQLKRVRGGAVIQERQPVSHPPFASRMQVRSQAKEHIARRAAELVADGDAILLDASSTVYYLAQFLQNRRNLTVVTNGIEVARALARNRSNTVILLGGVLSPEGTSVTGLLSEQLLKNLHIKTAFVSCYGFSLSMGLTEVDLHEAQIKSRMIASAETVVALIDASKFGKVDLTPFARLEQISHIFTDRDLSADWIEQLQRACVPFTVCDESTIATFAPCAKPDSSYKIGFANLTERMPFAVQVRMGLEQAAAAHKNIQLLIRDNDLDRRRALENVEWFIAQGVDLVIEYQIDAEAGNVIMDRFRQAGIPVIAVDIPLPGAIFFGADNYRAGFMAGEGLGRWIQAHWGGRFDLLVCLQDLRAGATPAARLQGGRDGLASVLGPFPDERVVMLPAGTLLEQAQAAMAPYLASVPAGTRVALLAVNDDAALGALAAFEAAGRLDEVVAVGQNADRLGRAALQRPDLPFIGSTSYAPENYGSQLIELALKLLRGQPVPPAVYIEHTFVAQDSQTAGEA
ncbi:MAG: substrate-binding domain-containing protein [Anaerolineae bacterium]